MPPPIRLLAQSALADLADIPATSRWVRSGGTRLHVLDYGGDGVPLVVLPGITSPAITMDFVAGRIGDLVRPIILDVRGRGLSDSGGKYSLEEYAEDTEALIRGLELDAPLLLGHSMGARIAATAAVRARVALRGTVLIDPPMSGPGRGPYPTPLEVFLAQLEQARRGTDADEVAGAWPRWPRRELELRARWLSSCDEQAIALTHRGFETDDFFDWWPAVPAPTTLIYGADSPVVSAAAAGEAARANPAANLLKVPAAGHMVFWDNPSASIRTLRHVLGTLVRPP